MGLKVLGEGGFGLVVKKRDGTYGTVAIKILPIRQEKHLEVLLHEAIMGKGLNHRYLMKCFDYKQTDLQNDPKVRKAVQKKCNGENIQRFLLLRTEYCNGGSLQDWIISVQNPNRSKESAELFFWQILDAIVFLKTKEVVHGDLKPQNIFLHHFNGDTIIKIGDFGESFYEKVGSKKLHSPTPLYQETKYDKKISFSYDIYSLGLIYSILLMSGLFKFDQDLTSSEESRKLALHNLLSSIKKSGSPKWMEKTHPHRVSMIRMMLNDKREERPDPYKVQLIFKRIISKPNQFIKSCPVPGQNPLFQGRSDILGKLEEICATQNVDISKCILLHGVVGSGKKSIAAEFIHSKTETEDLSQFIWFRSDTKKILENKYYLLKKEKNLKGTSSQESYATSIKNWLKTVPGWIVVYENVSSFKQIEDLIPISTHGSPGLLICTSRIDGGDYPDYFHKIRVDRLPLKDCTKLIHAYYALTDTVTEDLPSNREAEDLAKLMGFLPTAIGQSLAYIKSKNNDHTATIDKYIEFHKNNLKQLDNNDVWKLVKFSKTDIGPIYTTLHATVRQIKHENITAFNWLKICAYLDPENIPEIFFTEFLKQTAKPQENIDTSKKKVLNVLKSFAIIDFVEDETGTFFFTISRVVQEVVRIFYNSVFPDSITLIHKILTQSIPTTTNRRLKKFGSNLTIQGFTVHYESIINHIDNYLEFVERSENNSFPTLTSCITLLSTEKESFGRKLNHIKFTLLKRLGYCYKALMFHKQEQSTIQSVLKIKETIFGDDSLIRGTTLMKEGKHVFGSARVTGGLRHGEFERTIIEIAIPKLQEAAKVLEDCYETNSSRFEVHQCYLHLGDCYKSIIKFSDGMKGQRSASQTVPIKERVDKAQEYFNKALQVLSQVVLERDFQLLNIIGYTLRKIAETYEYLKELHLMEKYLILALEFYFLHTDSLKFKEPSTKWDATVTVHTVYNSDAEANNKLEEKSKISREIFKKIAILNNVQSYEVTEAMIHERFNNWRQNITGTSSILKPLLRCYKLAKELLLLQNKHKDRRHRLEFEDPESSKTLSRLNSKIKIANEIRNTCKLEENNGLNYVKNDDTNQIEKLSLEMETPKISKFLNSLQKNPKTDIITIAENKILLAKSHKKNFRIEEALKHYQEALEIVLKHRHRDHLSTATLYENIAECHSAVGETESACKMFKECYKIRKSNTVMVTKTNIGFAALIQKYAKSLPAKKVVKKIQLLEEALPILKSYYKIKHDDKIGQNEIGLVSEKLGSLFLQVKRNLDAEKYLLEARRIFQSRLAVGNQNRISCLKKLITVYTNLPNRAKVKEFEDELEQELCVCLEKGQNQVITGRVTNYQNKRNNKSQKQINKSKIKRGAWKTLKEQRSLTSTFDTFEDGAVQTVSSVKSSVSG